MKLKRTHYTYERAEQGMDIIEGLRNINGVTAERDFLMSAYTTFKTGGRADVFIKASDERGVLDVVNFLRERGVNYKVVGGGANLLVSDEGYRGALLNICISHIDICADEVICGAGAKLATLANKTVQAGLAGLEFASGIPGTVGGGVYMNAGAYDGRLSDYILSVRSLSNSIITEQNISQMHFDYRHSPFMENDNIILEARFKLCAGDRETSLCKIKDFSMRRRESQPLQYPSAGSTFKRPPGHFAGALIEQAGLKGLSIGGAQVSEKHAGFIINTGDATSSDIYKLIREVRRRVHDTHGVYLQPEVQCIGDFHE